MGNLSHLCIFYNSKGWSKQSSWSCWIPLLAWRRRDSSGGLNHLWILSWCRMDYISFGSFRLVLWHRAGIPWWVFGYCPLSSHLGFLEPMLCAWVVVTIEVVSQTNRIYITKAIYVAWICRWHIHSLASSGRCSHITWSSGFSTRTMPPFPNPILVTDNAQRLSL